MLCEHLDCQLPPHLKLSATHFSNPMVFSGALPGARFFRLNF